MKKDFSIVIYSKNNAIKTRILLKKLFKEINDLNNSIEVILIDTSKDNTIDILFSHFHNEIKSNKLKLIYSDNLQPYEARYLALDYIDGEYTYFIYCFDRIKNGFIKRLIDVCQSIEADITEFNVLYNKKSLFSAYNFETQNETFLHKLIDVKETPSLITFISPFFYTKVFKTSFLFQNKMIFSMKTKSSIFYIYTLFLNSTNYYFLNDDHIEINPFYDSSAFLIELNNFDSIINYYKEKVDYQKNAIFLEYCYLNFCINYLNEIINTIPDFDFITKKNLKLSIINNVVSYFPNLLLNPLIKENNQLQKNVLFKEIKIRLTN